jgi:hypothetical protein
VADNTSTIYPPWGHGENNPVIERGLEFTVSEVDNLPDFHGNPIEPALSIFVGGNYYFAMAPLVAATTIRTTLPFGMGLAMASSRFSARCVRLPRK